LWKSVINALAVRLVQKEKPFPLVRSAEWDMADAGRIASN